MLKWQFSSYVGTALWQPNTRLNQSKCIFASLYIIIPSLNKWYPLVKLYLPEVCIENHSITTLLNSFTSSQIAIPFPSKSISPLRRFQPNMCSSSTRLWSLLTIPIFIVWLPYWRVLNCLWYRLWLRMLPQTSFQVIALMYVVITRMVVWMMIHVKEMIELVS